MVYFKGQVFGWHHNAFLGFMEAYSVSPAAPQVPANLRLSDESGVR